MEPYIFHDIRSAQFIPLCAREDGISPQWHLQAFKIEEHGDVSDVQSATEAGEVILTRDSSVKKALRRLTVMFFKDVCHIFSNNALFMKYDQELEAWDKFM